MKSLLPWPAIAALAFSLPLRADPITVQPATLGNVFFTNETVRIPIKTQAETVSWTATDFLGQPAGKGTVAIHGGRAVVEPKLGPGYFDLTLAAPSGQTRTSLAALPPADIRQIVDSPYGVMTHFAQHWDPDLLALIARAGIKNIRDEQYWGHVETTYGQFRFPAEFEKYMAEARRLGIDPLIVLDFGNALHDTAPDAPSYGIAPFTDEGRAAYARYGQEVLRHYGAQIRAVEVWNEFNGTFGRGPVSKAPAGFYAEMLKTIFPVLKQTRPGVNVVGVSAVGVPLPYLESVFQRGALANMDAVSLHPYRTQSPPEGLERQLGRVQTLIRKYNGGQPKPLWITELGWPVKAADEHGNAVITEADQAKYLVRAITLAQSAGVEKFYWYNARNSPPFPDIGLLRAPDDPRGRYAPKPAYAAYATLTHQLTGARFEEREPTTNADTYALRFRRGADAVRVLWSLTPETLAVQAAGPLTVVDLVGASRTLTPANGVVNLPLADAPVYLRGAVSGLPPPDAGEGTPVADSEEGFSDQQGADGWSYGFFVAPAPGGPYAVADWKPLPRREATTWGNAWTGDAAHLMLDQEAAHPGVASGKPVWAVRRWTSMVAGTLRVRAIFNRPAQGDGTTARVFVNGKEHWHQLVGGSQPGSARCDFTAPVEAGSLVDIAVDPGPGLDVNYDNTSCHVVLTRLP